MDFYKQNKSSVSYYGDVAYDPSLGDGIAAAVRLEDTALESKLSAAIETVINSESYEQLSMTYFGTNVAPK